jgi:hypothetical protein
MRYQFSTALHLLRRNKETQWWWEKVVQKKVQTSIHFFRIHVCEQCTHRGIVNIRYGWRVSAPEKYIVATATTIACIVQIIVDVHNLLSTVQKGAKTTILHNLLGSVQ